VDGDGVAEPDDCAPRDAAVYPGAPDPCDGVDSDCVLGRCALELDQAQTGEVLRDITCAQGTRTCAAALRAGNGIGRIVNISVDSQPEALTVLAIDEPKGVAAEPNRNTGPVFWIIASGELVGAFSDGSVGYRLAAESPALNGRLAVSRFGTIGAATYAADSSFEFWSPLDLAALEPPHMENCGSSSAYCRALSLRNLSLDASQLGWKSPFDLAVRHDSESVPAQVYISFGDDTRIAVAVVSVTGALLGTSGLLEVNAQMSSFLSLNPSGARLAAVDAAGEGSLISTASNATGHFWQPFSVSGCPTAVLARDHDLLVASHCAGEEPELITLPILDGLPDETAAVTVPLPGCTPIRMAASPRLGDDGPDAVLLGCNDSSTVLVLGRD
jgi:hypothetical protein